MRGADSMAPSFDKPFHNWRSPLFQDPTGSINLWERPKTTRNTFGLSHLERRFVLAIWRRKKTRANMIPLNTTTLVLTNSRLFWSLFIAILLLEFVPLSMVFLLLC